MLIKVNNVNINYEEYGDGKPIILLHGNGGSYKNFDKLIVKLKENYKVYAIDSRCHGDSDDTYEISYELMANDVIEFIKTKQIQNPIIYGFSDGAIVGLMIAIREPNILSKLIISGANINTKGVASFPLFVCKLNYLITKNKFAKMLINETGIIFEDLEKIIIPVHVIAGEKDVIKKEHTKLIAEKIPNSTLEIISNETHGSYIVHSEKIYDIIKKYI